MTDNTQEIKDTIQRLCDRSADWDGTLIIRAVDAARIIGISREAMVRWHTKGHVQAVRVSCEVCRQAPKGIILCLHTDDVIECYKSMRSYTFWTPARENRLVELLSDRTQDYDSIGLALTVTADAVRKHCSVMGIDPVSAAGLYSVSDAAALLRVDCAVIHNWFAMGLKMYRHKAVGNRRLVDLEDVARFIRRHPRVRLDDDVLQKLGKMTGPIRMHKWEKGAA